MFLTDKQRKILTIVLICLLIILITLFCIKSCVKNYTITFDSDGGTYVSTLDIKKNNTISKPKDPQKDGYIFEGWYYNDELFDFNTKVTEDIILKAKWTKVEIKGISLNAQSLTLKPNGIAELEVIFTPDGAHSELTWVSSDESIVTINKFGKVTALKDGEATITVTTDDGKYKATCNIKVEKDAISVTSVTINGKKEVTVGDTIKLTVDIKPKDASNKDVKWTSSDKSIATIDSKGNVKGIKKGKVKINVKTVDGKKQDTIEIEVKEGNTATNPSTSTESNGGETTKPEENPKLTKVIINGSKTVEEGKTITLSFSVVDENYKYSSATWSIKNIDGEAKIDNGKVTGVKEGKVEVTLTVDGVSSTYEITITAKNVEYVITFTKLLKYDETWDQYELKGVTADGVAFTDFNYFTYNSDDFGTEQIKRVLNKSKINEGITSATMYLTNGKKVTAKVKYDSRKID